MALPLLSFHSNVAQTYLETTPLTSLPNDIAGVCWNLWSSNQGQTQWLWPKGHEASHWPGCLQGECLFLFLHAKCFPFNSIFYRHFLVVIYLPDPFRHVWWKVRPVLPCTHRPQYPWPQPSPCLQPLWATWSRKGHGPGLGWPEGRPLWSLLQPEWNDWTRAAETYRRELLP